MSDSARPPGHFLFRKSRSDAPWDPVPYRRRVWRSVRAVRRLLVVVVWTLLAMPLQALLLLLPDRFGLGRGKIGFARFYWNSLCWIIGMKVRRIGPLARQTADGRPIIYVANHTSWLDILVLGGQLEACFIAKSEVGGWPLIGTIARLGRTAFTSRQRTRTADERDSMRDRLAAGDNLILFPEGTSSDGSRVMAFRSAFLSLAEIPANAAGRPPLVQPVSLVFDRLAGLPTGRATRPLFAWYGDMDLAPHAWQLLQHSSLGATMLLHPPMNPEDFISRKMLSQATWQAVADGAATLRQNRLPRSQPQTSISGTEPAFV